MYAVSCTDYNASLHCFLFSTFQGKFYSLQGQWTFFTVNNVDDCLFRRTYQFPYNPQVKPLVRIAVTIGNSIPSLRIFTIWRVAGWQGGRLATDHEEASPNENAKRTAIHHRLLVPRGRITRGGVP